MENSKYLATWKKYMPVIRLHIKKSIAEQADQQFKLNAIDFELAGGRQASGNTFSVLLEDGKIANNVAGSGAARDLVDALKADDNVKAMLQNKSVKISLGSSFMLTIKTGHISSYK